MTRPHGVSESDPRSDSESDPKSDAAWKAFASPPPLTA